jgi:hypothetical protein
VCAREEGDTVASNSGIGFLLVFGLLAVGAASDPACGSGATTDPGSGSESNEDFSFEPEVSTGGAESGDGSEDPSDHDFSFEPEADAGSSP